MTSKHGWLFDLLHYGPVCSRVTDRHGLTVNILENGRDIIVDALTALNERESLTVSEICKRVNDHTSCPAFFIGEIECCFILTFYPDFFKMEKTPDSRFILHMMATRPKPRFKKYSDKVPIETILKMVTESGGTIGSTPWATQGHFHYCIFRAILVWSVQTGSVWAETFLPQKAKLRIGFSIRPERERNEPVPAEGFSSAKGSSGQSQNLFLPGKPDRQNQNGKMYFM